LILKISDGERFVKSNKWKKCAVIGQYLGNFPDSHTVRGFRYN
jgi:hypothetical protein